VSPEFSSYRPDPLDNLSRFFYFTATILFCWVGFWDAAGQDFRVRWPVTYFVLYVSLMLLAWAARGG